MKAEPRTHPNRAAGARLVERSLVPRMDTDWSPEKWTGKHTEWTDIGQEKTPRKDGAKHLQQVKAPLKQREK